MVEQRFRKAFSELTADADRAEPTRTSPIPLNDSTRTEANSQFGGDQTARHFLDTISCDLVMAQNAWITTRDATTLRRRLIALLAALG